MSCLSSVALLSVAAVAFADDPVFRRFDGGGPRATDCLQVVDVAGARGARRAAAARCTDGAPTCDVDGRADGTCTLRVRLCFEDSAAARCRPETVASAQLVVVPGLEALAATLETLTPSMPLVATDTCTDVADVAVARHGRRAGRVALRATAMTSSSRVDRDRLALVCRPPPPAARPATFATIERTVFAPSCLTASCHGAGRAGGLGLTRGEAFGSLVGMVPSNRVARESSMLRVAPGDTGRSFLLAKLTGNLRADEGSPMPFTGTRLPARSINLVRRWIAAGAPASVPF